MLKVGITGRSGSGKSSLGKFFAAKGYPVADGDELSRTVCLPGSPCLAELAAEFGADILDESGALNRRKLGELAFSSKENTAKLNGVVHPWIMRELTSRASLAEQQGQPLFFLDGAVIVDTPFKQFCDKLIVVVADYKLSVSRLVLRDGLSKVSVERRLAAQTSEERLRQAADYLVENNAGQENLFEQADSILEQLLQISGKGV